MDYIIVLCTSFVILRLFDVPNINRLENREMVTWSAMKYYYNSIKMLRLYQTISKNRHERFSAFPDSIFAY